MVEIANPALQLATCCPSPVDLRTTQRDLKRHRHETSDQYSRTVRCAGRADPKLAFRPRFILRFAVFALAPDVVERIDVR